MFRIAGAAPGGRLVWNIGGGIMSELEPAEIDDIGLTRGGRRPWSGGGRRSAARSSVAMPRIAGAAPGGQLVRDVGGGIMSELEPAEIDDIGSTRGGRRA